MSETTRARYHTYLLQNDAQVKASLPHRHRCRSGSMDPEGADQKLNAGDSEDGKATFSGRFFVFFWQRSI